MITVRGHNNDIHCCQKYNLTLTNYFYFAGRRRLLPDVVPKLGMMQERPPVHTNMATLDARLASFANWPKDKTQKPSDLAEAGFFYNGTICVYKNLKQFLRWDFSVRRERRWSVVLSLWRRTKGLGCRGWTLGAARKMVQHLQVLAAEDGHVVHHLCAEGAQTSHVTEGALILFNILIL